MTASGAVLVSTAITTTVAVGILCFGPANVYKVCKCQTKKNIPQCVTGDAVETKPSKHILLLISVNSC